MQNTRRKESQHPEANLRVCRVPLLLFLPHSSPGTTAKLLHAGHAERSQLTATFPSKLMAWIFLFSMEYNCSENTSTARHLLVFPPARIIAWKAQGFSSNFQVAFPPFHALKAAPSFLSPACEQSLQPQPSTQKQALSQGIFALGQANRVCVATLGLGQDKRPSRPPHGLVTPQPTLPSFGNNYRESPKSGYK